MSDEKFVKESEIDRDQPYFQVRVTQVTQDPYTPRYGHFEFANYDDAHKFATFACRSDKTFEVQCHQRQNGFNRVLKFTMKSDSSDLLQVWNAQITFSFNPTKYSIGLPNEESVIKLIRAMIAGEADWPNLPIQVEVWP